MNGGGMDGREVALALKAENGTLSGIIAHPTFFGPITDTTLADDEFSFNGNYEGNVITFKAKLSGDALRLRYRFLDHGDVTGSLKRLALGDFPLFAMSMRPEMTEYHQPTPKTVDPGPFVSVPVPSDALVLFDGKSLSMWKGKDGGSARWDVHDGVMTVSKGGGNISTRQKFGDYQLHLEWRVPADVIGRHGQERGNSGLLLQDPSSEVTIPRYWYEIQILDGVNNPTYVNGQAGSVFKQSPPIVNASRPPGQWNVYDVIYRAPRFTSDGSVDSQARVTLFHNGVLVQNDFAIRGYTRYVGLPFYVPHGKASITLQDHGEPVSFRNIWIREQ
jgi:hypothetical protein